MANPAKLTVIELGINGDETLGTADVIDTDGTVPVKAADTDGQPGRVLLDVLSKSSPQTVTIEASTAPQAVRRSLGDLVISVDATQAELETELVGDDNDLVFTAVNGGTGGNSITVAYVDPSGNDQELGVVVTDSDIVVNLATGPAGAITSTANDILAAIEADEDASALVTVALADDNTGEGVVTAMAETALSGGASVRAILGPFESARFEQEDGDMDIDFDIVAGQGFEVHAYLLPKGV